MELTKHRIEIASDVNTRDGIGIEVYEENELLIEIFRDDTDKTRTVTLFKENISLSLIEESIEAFKSNISWDFINYDELE
jgi:hypothetical protein